jgi:hypothetical protein
MELDFSLSEILDIQGIGCTILYLKSLNDCIKVCNFLNNQ